MALAIAFLSGFEPSAVSCFMSCNPKIHQNLARTFRIWLRRGRRGSFFATSPRVHPNNGAQRHSLRWPESTWLIYDCGVDVEMLYAHRGKPRTVCRASAPVSVRSVRGY